MTNSEPVHTVNLDQYGHDPLRWDAVAELLESGTTSGQDVFSVLGTVLPDGRPHAAPVGAMWIDGAWYVVTGPGTRKGRNLAHNPACTLSARLDGVDVVFTGRARRVTDSRELERVAELYRGGGWPAEVAGDAFTAPYTAPSGGPPPWNLYRIDCDHVVGVGTTSEVSGATKWTFA
jgi:nitroimidazol reductase NimA-like FMN-containing flavoprotein (pyridoxamine 5'-phosphate oxidase superfamily)